ncbi:hypothetical protein I7I48_02559 [Histoplasma ohiense]|nr:hypothetical protein I7I48_02559 [Histoplasma ohiense (nom. inval.)]
MTLRSMSTSDMKTGRKCQKSGKGCSRKIAGIMEIVFESFRTEHRVQGPVYIPLERNDSYQRLRVTIDKMGHW